METLGADTIGFELQVGGSEPDTCELPKPMCKIECAHVLVLGDIREFHQILK